MFIHPVVDRDLLEEFEPEELSNSEDLTLAIQDGYLSLKLDTPEYGFYTIVAEEYEPFSALNLSLPSVNFREEIVTESELRSTVLDGYIQTGVFPAQVSSTTAVTNIIVSNNSAFQDWRVDIGDKIVLSGTGGSDGTFTILEIINQTQLRTEEALTTTSGVGVLYIYHPSGASRIGVDSNTFNEIAGDNVQAVLESIDFAIGNIGSADLDGYLNEVGHSELNTLLHHLDEDYEVIPTFDGYGVMSSAVAQGQGGGTLIREHTSFTADSDGLITGFVVKQYDEVGVEEERLTTTINISSNIPIDAQVTKT